LFFQNQYSHSGELEARFKKFATGVRDFCSKLKWDIINTEYILQLIRSGSLVGANYIEASDDPGKADEKMKINISTREPKEAVYFPGLVLTYENKTPESEREQLINEGR
jgi:four helix bundle protein